MPIGTTLTQLKWGVQASAGAAIDVETTGTLGTRRTDERLPPTTSHIWGDQLGQFLDYFNLLSRHFKGGSRARCYPVSASPFGSGEHGLWALYAASGDQFPKWSTNSVAYQLLYQKFPRRQITDATGTSAATDTIIEVNRAGAVTLTLETISTTNGGRFLIVADISGAAAANNITLARGGSDTINGATSYVINQDYGWVMLYGGAASNWIVVGGSQGVGSSIIQQSTVSITNAQMLTLRASPITLVAAPGAGKFLEFISATLFFNRAAAYTETADNMAIRYTNGSGTIVSETIETTGFVDAAGDAITFARPLATPPILTAAGEIANGLLCIHNTGGDEFGGGNASNFVKVVTNYRVHTTGL